MTQSTINNARPHGATRTRLRLFALLLIASLGILLSGCKADTSPGAGRGDWYPAPMNDPQISVLDPQLREWIVFQTAIITRDDERPMTVQTPVRNLTERQYLIEYRYLFFDDNGRRLDPVIGWAFASLDPKQIVRLDGKALGLDAKDYRLEVRWSR
jgi:uncharacterized protein YcfL